MMLGIPPAASGLEGAKNEIQATTCSPAAIAAA